MSGRVKSDKHELAPKIAVALGRRTSLIGRQLDMGGYFEIFVTGAESRRAPPSVGAVRNPVREDGARCGVSNVDL